MASKKFILTLVCISTLGLLALGCGSDDDSNPVAPAPPIDTAPPMLPGNLDVDYSEVQQTAVITWNQNVTDADLAGYVVSRGSYDLTPTVLTETPQTANTFQDQLTDDCGRQITYYIYAVDTSDNMSAAATITLEFEEPVNNSPPPNPIIQ